MLIVRPSSLLLFGYLLVHYSRTFQLTQSSSSNFTDQSALLAFKSEIQSEILADNWSTTTNFCHWIGVSCSRSRQRVIALNLSYMSLQGTISPHIGNLSFLVSLILPNNSFHSFLPKEISRLHRLKILDLTFNQLEGNIPPTVQNCQKLEYLSLAGNKLSGAIPSSLSNVSMLEVLNLQDNSLTGLFPLVVFNISSLTHLALTSNSISGTLPMDLCSHCPNLQRLSIAKNEFNGQLPSKIYNCRELSVLSLSFNRFDGSIPEEFGRLEKLQHLDLSGKNLNGNIPHTIGNLSMLKQLFIYNTNIKGIIPSDLGRLSNLISLSFEGNDLTGAIPQNVFNISSLQSIALSENSLSGNIPLDNGLSSPNLELLYLHTNKLTGHIPTYLSNFSKLVRIDFAQNVLFGPIPRNLGNLEYLEGLSLENNQLTGEPEVQELNFISSLSNCRFLETLSISGNLFNSMLPDSIGNFSGSVRYIYATGSQIKGHIPTGIGSLKNLTFLYLSNNNLTGSIPSTFGGLETLQKLYLDSNNIAGFIPEELCYLRNLGELSLESNRITGSIPDCIGNLSLLQRLYLGSNRITLSIPMNLWSLENLLFLNLSSNSLNGYLSPNMRKLDVIEVADLSSNQITGNIPSIIGAFESLTNLSLSKNSFQGVIPDSFGELKGLESLDISNNGLSGAIPKSLEALPYLKYLNLSFNKLSGEIPFGGPFANFTAESFLENKALCGLPIFEVPSCTSLGSRGSRVRQLLLKYVLPAISSIIIFVALVYMLRKHRERNVHIASSVDQPLAAVEHRMISYQELCQATSNFCESNLLGIGGFGSVYKGILSDGTNVAIKVLNLQMEGTFKSFDAECKVLRTIRHRNLVKVISSCSNPELRALVLQYMSNGSLEKWLYSHNYCLNLLQRVNVMVDVALAVEYLHHGQSESVVHCDLKPTNILLDEDMVAHVADFGIAKILVENKEATQTKTFGTLGYIAPEYGFEGKVSTKGDVYSYGITLLEIMTRRKPTDEMFVAEVTLRQWINASLPDRIIEVVDNGLLRIEDGRDITTMKSILLSIMELGLRCSEEMPEERIDIKDVLVKLNKIKLSLLGNRNRGA